MHIRTLGIIAGGYSGEAEVSYRSAKTLMDHLIDCPWETVLISISEDSWTAKWKDSELAIDMNDLSFQTPEGKRSLDYAYIIIHGTPGEDGKLQGYLDMVGVAYNTGNHLNMALTFNKGATQRLLRANGINVADFVHLRTGDEIRAENIIKKVGLPCFVKPAEAGSSLGASKVKGLDELVPALEQVFKVDDEAMIERYVDGRELTCGVLSYKGEVLALPITEIISKNEFFDYAAKYDPTAADEITPADIDGDVTARCKQMTKDIYSLLDCQGVIRIDFFLCDAELFVIEVNTVPGFSERSIVPQQLEVEGIPIRSALLDIIETTSTVR